MHHLKCIKKEKSIYTNNYVLYIFVYISFLVLYMFLFLQLYLRRKWIVKYTYCKYLLFPCQPASAFMIIFTKLTWPPDYLVVWTYKQSIYEQKKRTEPLLFFFAFFILFQLHSFFFISTLKISCGKKSLKLHFCQKLRPDLIKT